MQRITVTWIDHSGDAAAWRDVDDAKANVRPVTVRTIGYLIHEEADYILVAPSVTDNRTVSGATAILKCAITRRSR